MERNRGGTLAAATGTAAVALTLAVALLVAGCGGDDDDGAAAPSSTTTSTTTPHSTSTSPTTTSVPTAPPVPVDPAWPRFAETWFVWGVSAGDVLNVRTGAGTSFPVVTTLPPGAAGVRLFDVAEAVGRAVWRPIEVPGGAGWVNVGFLRPTGPASPTIRGTSEPALAAAADAVRRAIQSADHAGLAALAHPARGVTFSVYAYTDESRPVLTREQLRRAATDETVILWGETDGEGAPIRQTTRQRLAEIAGSTALTSTTAIGFDVRLGGGNSIDNLADWFPGARVVEYHFDGTTRYADFDWTSVRLVFDTSQATPLLVGIVQDTWTI